MTAAAPRWRQWEDVNTTGWEDAGQLTITREFSDEIARSLDSTSPLYGPGTDFVHPAAIAQAVLRLLIEDRFEMEESANRTTLHAGQDSVLHRPLRVGETVQVRVRVADKYERRSKKWVIYEAVLTSMAGEIVYTYRQVRMLRDDSENAMRGPGDEKEATA